MARHGNDLDAFTKGQIHALKYHAQFSCGKIARSLQLSRNTVKQYIRRVGDGQERGVTQRHNCGI